MAFFPYAHCAHAQWQVAVDNVVAQLRAQMAFPEYAANPSLGLLYLSDPLVPHASSILSTLAAELPLVTDWSGTVGAGICATGTEYFDVGAMAVMLLDLPSDQYRVFSGVSPLGLGFEANTALVHGDGATPDITELVRELAQRTDSGFLFGGMSSSRQAPLQFAIAADGNISGHGGATGLFQGGLSGVAFARGINVVSRVTQGCKPVGREHTVTAVHGNLLLELDDKPALHVMLAELGVSLDQPQRAMEALRTTLLGMTLPGGTLVHQTGNFGHQVTVRHIIGIDPARAAVAVAEQVQMGMRVAFCQRNVQAARADLVRVWAEIRDAVETGEISALSAHGETPADADTAQGRHISGAVYVSCVGRGGAHFGGPHAELQIVRRSLGNVPLVGFFADGEIGYDHLYGYTGVLSVFTASD